MRKAIVLSLGVSISLVLGFTSFNTGAAGENTSGVPSREFRIVGDGTPNGERPPLGADRAPLSAAERSYAAHLALAALPAGTTDVHGNPGAELLLIELPDQIESSGRVSEVVVYDYTADETHLLIVDLRAGTATKRVSASEVQPPPSHDETVAAVALALTAAPPLPFVNAFEQLQRVPLVDPSQIHYAGGAWVYDDTRAGGRQCREQRCVQLMVSLPSGTYLDTRDFVVNLSQQKIISLGRSR